MKYPLSVTLSMALSLAAMAQSGSSGMFLDDLSSVNIRLKKTGPARPCAFNHFEVIDQRPDTARIGIHAFVSALPSRSRNEQLVFPQPAATEIAGYLDKYFARPDAHCSALIILRNLWLSDANYLRDDRTKDPEISTHRTHIRLKAEIYACIDSVYIPIVRFDTLQTYKRNSPYKPWSSYYSLWENDLTWILSEMTDSASALAAARVQNGRHLSREDILQFNQSRFEPTITASNMLTRGVYTSFQEFRDNAPSIQDFEVLKDKTNHVLYLKDTNGAAHYSRDAWGYCDGKDLFIMWAGRLYPLRKEGKAFYFLGKAYREDISYGPPVFADGPPPARTSAPAHNSTYAGRSPYLDSWTANCIYTVDMDSGNAY